MLGIIYGVLKIIKVISQIKSENLRKQEQNENRCDFRKDWDNIPK